MVIHYSFAEVARKVVVVVVVVVVAVAITFSSYSFQHSLHSDWT